MSICVGNVHSMRQPNIAFITVCLLIYRHSATHKLYTTKKYETQANKRNNNKKIAIAVYISGWCHYEFVFKYEYHIRECNFEIRSDYCLMLYERGQIAPIRIRKSHTHTHTHTNIHSFRCISQWMNLQVGKHNKYKMKCIKQFTICFVLFSVVASVCR